MSRAAVVIGIGGGGKVILMKMRRLIVEEYGSLSALPHVRFLHVDTHTGRSVEPSQNFKDKALGVDLLFSKGEERVELSSGLAGLDREKLVRDNRVKAWYPDDFPVTCNFEDGAGGVRPFGKIAFHYNAYQFEQTLNKVADAACRAGTGGVDAFVVASLFGGTGSGTFLDVCYNVRKVLKTMGFDPTITGWFVIGARRTDPNMQSSCYAALQELEYFTTVGIMNTLQAKNVEDPALSLAGMVADYRPFEARYPIAGVTDVTSRMPPVDVCYLFGATNAEEVIFDRDRLEETISKRIFFEVMEGIGIPLQGKRVDIMNQPSYYAPDRLQGRAKTFFSTGISVIEFPAPQIQNALASGLAAACCHYALFRSALGLSDLKSEVNAFMDDLGLKEGKMREQFERQDSRTVPSSIRDDTEGWRRRLKSKIEAKPFDRAGLEQEVQRVKQEAQDRVREAQDPKQSGTYVQTINNNAERVWQEKWSSIAVRIGEMVGDKSIGPGHCEGFISEVRARLASDRTAYYNLQKKYDARLRSDSSVRVDWRIRRFMDDLHPKYHWELGKHSQWLCEKELAQFLTVGSEKAVCKSAGDLIHRVDQEMERLQAEVETYVNRLNTWGRGFIENMMEIFRNLRDQEDNDPVNQKLRNMVEQILKDFPQDNAKWEEITQTLYERFVSPLFKEYRIPNPIGNMDTVSEEIVKDASGGKMGDSLFRAVLTNESSFKTSLFDLCRTRLDGIRKVSVCDLLMQLNSDKRNRILEEKRKRAAWLLQVDANDETINHAPALCEKKWVGVWQGVNPQTHPIWTDLSGYDVLDRMPSLPEPYRMVFVSEIGVFPLRNIHVIEDHKRAHENIGGSKKQNTFKDIDFPDIFPPSPLLKGIHMRAERASLLGRIFGFLKEGEDPQDHYTKVYLYYSDEVSKTRKNQFLCNKWEETTNALRNAQEEKDIAKKRSDITPTERLEKEIQREGTSAMTKEAREALWQKTEDYLAERLKELGGSAEHPFYQSDLEVIEAFRKDSNLYAA